MKDLHSIICELGVLVPVGGHQGQSESGKGPDTS